MTHNGSSMIAAPSRACCATQDSKNYKKHTRVRMTDQMTTNQLGDPAKLVPNDPTRVPDLACKAKVTGCLSSSRLAQHI